MNEVKLIYQDCVMCFANTRAWAIEAQEKAQKHKLNITLVSFASPEAKGLPELAQKYGLMSMPFLTDGKKCSMSIEEFIEKVPEKPRGVKKAQKKTQQRKQAVAEAAPDFGAEEDGID